MGAQSHFRRVGLADDNRPGRTDALDLDIVEIRHEIAVDRRAEDAGQPLGLGQILHRMRQTVHPATRTAGFQFGIGDTRLVEQRIAVPQADDRIHLRIDRGDAVETGGHHLAAGKVAVVDGGGKVEGGKRGDVGHDGFSWLVGYRW